jgi:exopolysaccharide biosynthesis protein
MTKLKKRGIIFSILVVLSVIILYITYPMRVILAGTILTTQHPQYAWVSLLTPSQLKALREDALHPIVVNSVLPNAPTEPDQTVTDDVYKTDITTIAQPQDATSKAVELIEIDKQFSPTHYFKGRLVKVNDPTKVRLVAATIHDAGTSRERGEWLEEMVKSTGAIAALNASGFNDPSGMNWASKPMGLVIIDGKLIQDYDIQQSDTALAITYDGKLVTGNYSAAKLLEMGVRSAVSFKPQLVVDGKSLFTKDLDAWGYQPRSAVGQTADGTIILLQIDGRRTASIGASMKDAADLMVEYGAINAMAMDGGTSAFLSYQGETKTVSPVDDKRGRFLPNAWIVTK